MTALRLLCLMLVMVTGCALESAGTTDPESGEEVDEATQELSSLSCSMSSATGYVKGSAFSIKS